jgi:hypothetical protein
MTSAVGDFTPERIHLVGSIGLGSVEEIFRTVGRRLGGRLKRVPDGEIGAMTNASPRERASEK